jgi:hypothetical protein
MPFASARFTSRDPGKGRHPVLTTVIRRLVSSPLASTELSSAYSRSSTSGSSSPSPNSPDLDDANIGNEATILVRGLTWADTVDLTTHQTL